MREIATAIIRFEYVEVFVMSRETATELPDAVEESKQIFHW